MSKFEDDMQSLERLAADIKRNDITLEEALKDFEEGIQLSKKLEKELDAIEGKVMKLMNSPDLSDDDAPSGDTEGNGDEAVGTEAGKPKRKAPKAKAEGPLLDLFTPSGEINGTRNA
ncbi:MAG: exodeoxyribonuclease VII small subunit [Treponema sp.]|nr:exodeoxyribonuclease VII small subunit [Treponema sp.]